jgi:hypothetical protein
MQHRTKYSRLWMVEDMEEWAGFNGVRSVISMTAFVKAAQQQRDSVHQPAALTCQVSSGTPELDGHLFT